MALDFSLTEEQVELQKLARRFAREQVAPVAGEYDEKEEVPWPLVEKLHEIGLLNVGIPEENGGLGLGLVEEVIIGEELGWADMGFYTIPMASELGITPLLIAGNAEQKERFLRPLTERPALAAFALSEPGNGSDAAALKTRAERVGDHYVVNGTKMWISNAAEADWTVVFATFDPELRHKGVVALVVERDREGVSFNKIHGKMGQRAAPTYEMVLEDVKVPVENREREAFGRPIIDFQAIQFKLADMMIGLETARMYTYYAAWLADRNDPRHIYASAIAKAYASEIAFDAANEAIQIHGGYGYVNDFPVEKLLRDVKLNQIYEGTNEIQRVIVARHIKKNVP